MRDSLRNKVNLFTDNYQRLSNKFKWGYTINNKLGALLYTMEDRVVDVEAISICRQIIKDNTGIFSQFKDITNFMISVMLSLKPEPEIVLRNSIGIYNDLKDEGFHSSSYLVLAAVSIAQKADPSDYQRIIITTKSFYDAMKQQHPFITSYDDYGFAALLAMSGKPADQAVREMEECYRILKQDFSYSNSVQSLAEVLTFSEEYPSVKCKRVVDLYQALRQRKCKFSADMQLSFLGVTAVLKEETNKLADEIAEMNEYLKQIKGFGLWTSTAGERAMFAAALVCDDYLFDTKRDTMGMTLVNNTAGIILAQQMATIAAATIASASAATSASV